MIVVIIWSQTVGDKIIFQLGSPNVSDVSFLHLSTKSFTFSAVTIKIREVLEVQILGFQCLPSYSSFYEPLKSYLCRVLGQSCSLILPPLVSQILFGCLIFNCYSIKICQKEKLKDETSKKNRETNGNQ